jgi:phospholipid transport system substrate-binding protein
MLTAVLFAAPGPMAVVKAADADVQRLLSTNEATVEKLAKAADNYVDFGELAKRALGEREWAKLDKKRQDEFSATMKGLLRASYAQKALGDGQNGAKFDFVSESLEANEATVKSTLVSGPDRFPVTYKLYRSDKIGWRIYDVVTDDVSLVGTYSDQFRKVIASKGFDGLLVSLKAKKEQLEKTSASSGGGSAATR